MLSCSRLWCSCRYIRSCLPWWSRPAAWRCKYKLSSRRCRCSITRIYLCLLQLSGFTPTKNNYKSGLSNSSISIMLQNGNREFHSYRWQRERGTLYLTESTVSTVKKLYSRYYCVCRLILQVDWLIQQESSN